MHAEQLVIDTYYLIHTVQLVMSWALVGQWSRAATSGGDDVDGGVGLSGVLRAGHGWPGVWACVWA